jgi:cytochrome c oxidase subunit II
MGKYKNSLLYLFIFLVACGTGSDKKKSAENILQKGSELYDRYGCYICHSLDGSVVYGPPLNDIYMKEVKVIRKGKERTLVADRRYLVRAIADPRYEKVADYRNKEMPETLFSKEEAEILADYLIALSLKNMNENLTE